MDKWYTTYSNILYLHFSEGFYKLPESAKEAVSPKSPLFRFFKIAGYTVVRLFGNLFSKVEEPEKLKGKIWLYVVSQNNYDSLKFLENNLADSVAVAGQSKAIGKYNTAVNRISLRSKLLYYYKFIPLLYLFFKDKKKIAIRFTDVLYDSIGFYEVYKAKLKKLKPAAVIFANDHNPDARAMLLAARDLGIKTIYIQHASVSPIFPPLAFDLNLLEGQDSFEKYKMCGPISGKVEFIGMPKADQFVTQRNTNKIIKTIGIGCNLMDNTESIISLIRSLSADFTYIKLKFRAHPRDSRNFRKILSDIQGLTFSDVKTESVFEYLTSIDALISGNSGIHLEAVLLNVWSINYYMNPKESLQDYYGFIKNNLVDLATDYIALRALIMENKNNKPEVYHRAKYFNATVATEYDGRSSELAVKKITDFINAS